MTKIAVLYLGPAHKYFPILRLSMLSNNAFDVTLRELFVCSWIDVCVCIRLLVVLKCVRFISGPVSQHIQVYCKIMCPVSMAILDVVIRC